MIKETLIAASGRGRENVITMLISSIIPAVMVPKLPFSRGFSNVCWWKRFSPWRHTARALISAARERLEVAAVVIHHPQNVWKRSLALFVNLFTPPLSASVLELNPEFVLTGEERSLSGESSSRLHHDQSPAGMSHDHLMESCDGHMIRGKAPEQPLNGLQPGL